MQFDRDLSGELTPLPRPSIDTGMGLERITAVLQGKTSNFETDLLMPLILQAMEIAMTEYGQNVATDTSLRVIADHSRAAAFLVSDGITPSNEGRGYVLRKILRRAIRHGKLLGVEDPFLFKLTGHVAELMKDPYPELLSSREYVAKVVKNEEQRFASTVRLAIDQLSETLERIKMASGPERVVPGDVIFKFYDTFGLPLDLMQEIADENQVTLDEAGFNERLKAQRERGRASWMQPQNQSSSDKPEAAEFYGATGTGPALCPLQKYLLLKKRISSDTPIIRSMTQKSSPSVSRASP
jgi:alanyl-tRNA synthetase